MVEPLALRLVGLEGATSLLIDPDVSASNGVSRNHVGPRIFLNIMAICSTNNHQTHTLACELCFPVSAAPANCIKFREVVALSFEGKIKNKSDDGSIPTASTKVEVSLKSYLIDEG